MQQQMQKQIDTITEHSTTLEHEIAGLRADIDNALENVACLENNIVEKAEENKTLQARIDALGKAEKKLKDYEKLQEQALKRQALLEKVRRKINRCRRSTKRSKRRRKSSTRPEKVGSKFPKKPSTLQRCTAKFKGAPDSSAKEAQTAQRLALVQKNLTERSETEKRKPRRKRRKRIRATRGQGVASARADFLKSIYHAPRHVFEDIKIRFDMLSDANEEYDGQDSGRIAKRLEKHHVAAPLYTLISTLPP